MRAGSVIDLFPMPELAIERFHFQRTGRDLVKLLAVAWGLLEHCGEHYGQLAVYYRGAGLVPPESRPKK